MAEKVAEFWVSRINSLGSSGNPMADVLHSMVRQSQNSCTENDLNLFKQRIQDYCMSEFQRIGESLRFVPLGTDYGPDWQLTKAMGDLDGKISGLLPWKTVTHVSAIELSGGGEVLYQEQIKLR